MNNYHPKFKKVMEVSERVGETNDCTVKCFAILANIEYTLAHSYLKSVGRKNRRGPQWSQFWQVWEKAGLQAVMVWSRDAADHGLTPKTVGKKFPKGRYVVCNRTHVAAMIDGQIIDWSENTRKRVTQVWRIIDHPSQEQPGIIFG